MALLVYNMRGEEATIIQTTSIFFQHETIARKYKQAMFLSKVLKECVIKSPLLSTFCLRKNT